jgi:alanyl-tRNA synthetase
VTTQEYAALRLPTATTVTYPAGSLEEVAVITTVVPRSLEPSESGLLVFTEVTPFHPLDPLWPDQPADRGAIHLGAQVIEVHDTVTVARRGIGPLMVGGAIDARRDEPGVLFLVAHVVEAEAGAHLRPSNIVTLRVDEERRRRLNAAHTACHLLAYALNESTDALWHKLAATDSRGHRDLDAASCVSTAHDIDGSRDSYRLGKSLRKRGFDSARFLEELEPILDEVNRRLNTWIEADSPVWISADGPLLTDRRNWVCELPGGTAEMSCGGTHVRRLGEILEMTATARYDGETGTLHIRNLVRVRDR